MFFRGEKLKSFADKNEFLQQTQYARTSSSFEVSEKNNFKSLFRWAETNTNNEYVCLIPFESFSIISYQFSCLRC